MRFRDLVERQASGLRTELTARYSRECAWGGGADYSETAICSAAEELSTELLEKFQDEVSRRYCFVDKEARDVFGKDLAKLIERGFLLLNRDTRRYLPPEEVVAALVSSGRLVSLVCRQRKADLKLAFAGADVNLNKDQMIEEIIRNPALGAESDASAKGLAGAAEMLGSFASLVGCEYSAALARWRELLPLPADRRRDLYQTSENKALRERVAWALKAALQARVVFMQSSEYEGFMLHWHPVLGKAFASIAQQKAEQEQKRLITEMTAGQEPPVNPAKRRLHTLPEDSARKVVLLCALLERGDIALTKKGDLSARGLKQAAQRLSGKKGDRFEETKLLFLYENIVRFQAVAQSMRTARVKTNPKLFALTGAGLANKIRHDTGLNEEQYRSFLKALPEDRWISLEKGLSLFRAMEEASGSPQPRRISAEKFEGFVNAACDYFGELDVCWEERCCVVPGEYSWQSQEVEVLAPVLLRKVRVHGGHDRTRTRKQAVLQPNFEILLPPDLDLQVLYGLAVHFELTGPHTLTLNANVIARAGQEFKSAKEFWAAVGRWLEGEPPANVHAFVEERFTPAKRVVLGEGFIYVSDPAACSQLQQLAGKYIVRTVDSRLCVLSYQANCSVLRDRLRKANFIVEEAAQERDADELDDLDGDDDGYWQEVV